MLTKMLIICLTLPYCLEQALAGSYDVMQFGAIGDGIADDAQAFLAAWGYACRDPEAMPTLIIPAGKTFSLSPLQFHGPCTSPNIHIQLSGTVSAPQTIAAWTGCESNSWIVFKGVDGLILEGCGAIDGQGSPWWSKFAKDVTLRTARKINKNGDHNDCSRPTALHFENCSRLIIDGLTHLNSPKNHISINKCNGVDISYVDIVAPQDSPNTDGIDISSSSVVFVRDSRIQTGDDCIAINSGSSKINITNVHCGPGHGISVGSLGANGAYSTVEEVYIQNCNFSGSENGARIKTWPGGSGYAKNINFENILFNNVKNPIIIDQHYCENNDDCPEQPEAVQVSDVTYRYVQGSSATKNAIILDCSENVPCVNIVLEQIYIVSDLPGEPVSVACKNAQGISYYTDPIVPCLSTE